MNIPESIPAFALTVAKSYGGIDYSVINLDNAFLPNTDMQNRVFRSMIKVGDKIVCIAPLKSIPNDDYSACFHAGDRLRVTEMIEGTMINLFHNGVGWELATKKSIGCDYHYFRTSYEGLETEQKTFRQMFYDAIGTNDLAEFVAKYGFTQDHCYSFVLQHAANHIVLSIDNPRAYLVSCFALSDLHMVDVQTLGYPSLPRIFNYRLGALTNLDGCFSDKPMDDCVEDYATDVLGGIMDAIKNPLNTSNVCGLMVTNMSNGFRTGFVNPVYNELKILRGNNPNLHYQYLVLRKTGKVMNFLRFFPQYKKHFAQFKEHFNSYVTRLHNLYINIYVLKINKMDDVTDKRDKYHLSKLHFERYLPALRAFKQHVLEQTNGLEDVKSKSEDSNAKPKDSNAKPKDSSAKPKDSSAKPKDSSAKPKDSNAKPKITLRDVYNYMDSEGVICPF